jgi:DNA-binding NarL/FixJ family response regulator
MSPSSGAAPGPISVLVADSNRMQAQLLTGALRRRAEFRVAACRMETAAILKAVASSLPRVAVLSLDSPANIGETITTLRRFHLTHPDVAKILLVDACDREVVVSAFRSGVRGIFCLTEADIRMLCKCLLRVAAGQIWVSTDHLDCLLELISEVPSLRLVNSRGDRILTPREEQVVALVAEGFANRQVARELGLSEHTVKKYLFRIFEKLGISSRVELVLYAVNNGAHLHAQWLAPASRDIVPNS